MKAISLWEPWASAMRIGRKENETRSWPTSYRGDLVICAAKRKMTKDDVETLFILVDPLEGENFVAPYGCALCVVELWECCPTAAFLSGANELSGAEQSLGNYTYGRFVWRTRNRRPLKEPVPILGRQGLWNLTPEEEAAVKAQL